MLHLATVKSETLGLLKKLMILPELAGFNLAGGTALALQIGHRSEIIDAYNAKYADGSEFLVLKSIIYFDDAEEDDMPAVFDSKITWPLVRSAIEDAARKL